MITMEGAHFGTVNFMADEEHWLSGWLAPKPGRVFILEAAEGVSLPSGTENGCMCTKTITPDGYSCASALTGWCCKPTTAKAPWCYTEGNCGLSGPGDSAKWDHCTPPDAAPEVLVKDPAGMLVARVELLTPFTMEDPFQAKKTGRPSAADLLLVPISSSVVAPITYLGCLCKAGGSMPGTFSKCGAESGWCCAPASAALRKLDDGSASWAAAATGASPPAYVPPEHDDPPFEMGGADVRVCQTSGMCGGRSWDYCVPRTTNGAVFGPLRTA